MPPLRAKGAKTRAMGAKKRARRDDGQDDSVAVETFVSMTGCDEALARRRLRAVSFDLPRALDAHFAIGEAVERGGAEASTTGRAFEPKPRRRRIEEEANAFADARARAMRARETWFLEDSEGFYRSIPLVEEAEAFTANAFLQFLRLVERDAATSSETPWRDETFTAGPSSVDGREGASGTSESVPACRCGVKAKVKQVSKDGANQGRFFYGCAKPASEKSRCDFFTWAREETLVHTDAAKSLTWKRFAPPRFKFARRTSSADIRQGSVGDCWFLSALAVIAERDDLLDSVVGFSLKFASVMENFGSYFVRLFLGGRWRAIVVDDALPVKPKKDDEYSPAFSRAANNQTWVSIVEKAYAKAHGSYAAISGGYVAEGLHDLTGSATEMISFQDAAFDSEEFWARLMSFSSAGFPLGCATSFSAEGIVGHHAYSIIEVRELNNVKKGVQTKLTEVYTRDPATSHETENLRLLKIRNPWGKKEWRGEFSSTSESWTKRLGDLLSRTRANDGEFWMSYHDFLAYFSSVDVCKSPKGWESMNLEMTLHREQPPPTFIVRSRDDAGCWCHVLLLQHTKRGRPNGVWYTDLSVLVWSRTIGTSEWTPNGGIFGARERESCQGEIMLDPGVEYAFRVLSVAGGHDVPVTLRLCAAKQIRARPVDFKTIAGLNVSQNVHVAIHDESSLTGGCPMRCRHVALCGGFATVATSSGLSFVFIRADDARKTPLHVDLAYRHKNDGSSCYQFQKTITVRPGNSRVAVVASGVSAHRKHDFEFDYSTSECTCESKLKTSPDDDECIIVGETNVEKRSTSERTAVPQVAPRRCEELFAPVDSSFWPSPLETTVSHVKRGSFRPQAPRIVKLVLV